MKKSKEVVRDQEDFYTVANYENIADDTTTTANADNNDTVDNTVNVYCIVDNLFSKKPVFNEELKTIYFFAEKNIVIKPRELKVIDTSEKIYISNYTHNFGTISNRYSGTFLIANFKFLNEGNLNQHVRITLKNLSCFTYNIPEGTELGKITFVTNKKLVFQLVNTYQIIFDPLTKTLLKNDNGKELSKRN